MGRSIRNALLAMLCVAPLAFGAVHEPVWAPVLIVCAVAGGASLLRGTHPAGPAIGGRFALAFGGLAAIQLVPLPPGLLRVVSPGSFQFHDEWRLLPLDEWRSISVSPPDTLRGLLFVAAFGLAHTAFVREFRDPVWRRRLALCVVATALAATVVGLVQAAAGIARVYGLWEPAYTGALFGPYVNKNHYAGYVAMATPLALGLASRHLRSLGHAWTTRRRRARWLALGDAEGTRFLRWVGVALMLVVGILAARSRGGMAALAASAVLMSLKLRRRVVSIGLVIGILAVGLTTFGTDEVDRAFARTGLHEARVEIWKDALRMVPRFPLFGTGLDSFGTAYPRYQRIDKSTWWGEVHCDYLQVLLDTGFVGLGLAVAALSRVLRRAWALAGRGSLEAGFLGAVLASCVHASFDFNWQIPANALTFVALAAIASTEPHESGSRSAHPAGSADC